VNVSARAALAALAILLLPAALAAQKPATPKAAAPKRAADDTVKIAKPIDLAPRTKGSATAPVTVYEMSDFQCPFCRRHAVQTFPELERDYIATGKVRWVFVNLPLTQLHANAAPAAEVAMCSGKQGKFWEVHDLIFRNQAKWAPLKEPGQYFLTFADSAGLDRAALQKCLASRETIDEIEQDAVGAVRSGATSTPTFYIEGGLLEGAQPAAVFRQVLDSIHAAKSGAKR
jgi:protein-disulfide isomerase